MFAVFTKDESLLMSDYQKQIQSYVTKETTKRYRGSGLFQLPGCLSGSRGLKLKILGHISMDVRPKQGEPKGENVETM